MAFGGNAIHDAACMEMLGHSLLSSFFFIFVLIFTFQLINQAIAVEGAGS